MNVIVDQVWSGVAVGLTSQPVNGKPPQVLFIVPWRNKSMIGTCHIPWRDAPHTFKLNEAMVQEFLDQINSAHPPLSFPGRCPARHLGIPAGNKADANKQPVRLT